MDETFPCANGIIGYGPWKWGRNQGDRGWICAITIKGPLKGIEYELPSQGPVISALILAGCMQLGKRLNRTENFQKPYGLLIGGSADISASPYRDGR
jgi:hypothetical protein